MTTGIVVALAEELSTLTVKRLKKGEILRISDALICARSGAGRENAAQAAQLLIANGAKRLISWGCVAGISPIARPGALIVVSRCLTANRGELVSASSWNERAESLLSEYSGKRKYRLVESSELVLTSEAKVSIAHQSGADALDMESAAIAAVAESSQLPFLVIRAVADPVEMSLPNAVRYALDTQGEVNLAKLLNYLFWHPSQLPGLIRLGMHFSAAKKTLKSAAGQLEAIAAA